MTNTLATNVMENCCSKKVRYKFDCYILLTVLLAIILLLIISITFIILQNKIIVLTT